MIKHFNTPAIRFILWTLFTLGISTSVSFGQGTTNQGTNGQRQSVVERHKKLAEMHTKMAACLDSDKALTVCRQEMIDSCSSHFGGTCPMMGKGKKGGKGKGMMGGQCMDWMTGTEGDTTVAPQKTQPAK